MALPKLNVPKYKLKLPSDGRTVNFRPFLVKEEKLLLLATETGDTSDIVRAIKGIISACTDITEADVNRLPTYDIEFLFLQIRTKSVGETVEVLITCQDDGETEVEVQINIDDIQIYVSEDHDRDIKLDDELSIRMKYPSLEEFVKTIFDGDSVSMDQGFDIITSCVDQVYSEEESWNTADCTKKELDEFIGNLTSSQFAKVEKFFSTMPKLSHTLKVTNPKTGVENEVVLEGLASFFA